MLILKNNPVGIDIPINKAQKQLHKYLLSAWGLSDKEGSYLCYGRAYRNQYDRGYVAEVYKGADEYEEVYWNDTLTAISFFGISSGEVNNVLHKVDVHLVFFVDLNKLALKDRMGQVIQHRSDEETRQTVFKALGKISHGFTYKGFDIGIERVLLEYPGTYRDERLKFRDMHPLHCFRMNYELIYDPYKIC